MFLLVSSLLLFSCCIKNWSSWREPSMSCSHSLPEEKEEAAWTAWYQAVWVSMRSVSITKVSFPNACVLHYLTERNFFGASDQHGSLSESGSTSVYYIYSTCLPWFVLCIPMKGCIQMQLSSRHSTKPCASLEISGKASKLLRGSRGNSFLFWSGGPF